MKTITKYIVLSLLKNSLAVVFVLVTVFSFFSFLEELRFVGTKNYSITEAGNFILFRIPSLFFELSNYSIMIGAAFLFGRLINNKELQIFLIGGLSKVKIVSTVLLSSLFFSIIVLVLNELVAVDFLRNASIKKFEALNEQSLLNDENIWIKQESRFIQMKKKGIDNFKNIRIFEKSKDNRLKSLTMSNEITREDDLLSLHNSEILSIKNSDGSTRIEKNRAKQRDIKLGADSFNLLYLSPKNFTILDNVISLRERMNNKVAFKDQLIEIIQRIFKPLLLILMLLISLPSSMTLDRGHSISRRVALTILIGVSVHFSSKITTLLYLNSNLISTLIFIPLILICVLAWFQFSRIRDS